MDQKDNIIDQKGRQMYEKRQKKGFSDLKYLLFNGIFLSGIWGYPPPPLNGKSSCPKPLAEMGSTPPLGGRKSLIVFDSVPKGRSCLGALHGCLQSPGLQQVADIVQCFYQHHHDHRPHPHDYLQTAARHN